MYLSVRFTITSSANINTLDRPVGSAERPLFRGAFTLADRYHAVNNHTTIIGYAGRGTKTRENRERKWEDVRIQKSEFRMRKDYWGNRAATKGRQTTDDTDLTDIQ
jgi:hypothetical protein